VNSLFSLYPSGLAGVALLALRGSAVAVLVQIFIHVGPIPALAELVLVIIGGALLLGVFGRIAAVLGFLTTIATLLGVGGDFGLAVALHGVDMMALALLGPGAYSIDSRRFGRRVLKLDP
jgi:hypothetical protein